MSDHVSNLINTATLLYKYGFDDMAGMVMNASTEIERLEKINSILAPQPIGLERLRNIEAAALKANSDWRQNRDISTAMIKLDDTLQGSKP